MWSLVLAISLAIAKGDIEVNHDCQLRTHEVCQDKIQNIPDSFPGSKAELEIACNAIKDYMLCGISVEERCNFEPGSIPMARKVLTVVDSVCDKNSQLHKDVVENLECMKGYFEDQIGKSCFRSHPDDEKIKEHEKHFIDQGLINSDEVDNRICLKNVHDLACFALKLENTCGEVAMNAFVKIIVKSTFVLEGCNEEILELLPIAVSLHKLEDIEAELEVTTEPSSDVCKKPLNETCIPDAAALVFPGTPEKVDQACKAEIDFMECTIQVEEKCQFNPEELPDLKESLTSTRKICDKDTALYEGIKANINCAKPLFDNSFGECASSTQDEEKVEAYSTSLHRGGIPVFTIKEEDQAECAKGLYALACAADKIEENCGDKAMEAFVTVLSIRTRPLTKKCSDEFEEHLLDVIRVWKVVEEKEEEIETLFENIMK